MKLVPGQITGVAGPMATEGVVATVEVGVADSEEDREDIKLSPPPFLLKIHDIYWLPWRATGKAQVMDNPVAGERGQHEHLCRQLIA